MKKLITLIILSISQSTFSQDEVTSLSKSLTEFNQKSLNDELSSVFKIQKPNEVETLDSDILELQVANENLKKKIEESLLPTCQDQNGSKSNQSKIEKIDGGWEVVLLVKASHEKLRDEQDAYFVDTINETHKRRYVELILSENENELEDIFLRQTKNMNKDEILDYIAFIGAYLPYDQKRANGEGDNKKGARDLFDILSEQRSYLDGEKEEDEFGGICGDIHYALGELVKMANKSGKIDCEYITMSYQTTSIGHVIGGCANSDGSFLVLNYGEVRNIDSPNGVASLTQGTNNTIMPDVGNRMRIFGHSEKGSEHIATLKNEVGSFLYAMNLKTEKQTASPLYEDYSSVGAELNHKVRKEETKGDKTITKNLNEGLRFYTGKLQGGQDIFGVALFKESTKTNDKNNLTLFNSNSLSVNNVKYPSTNSLEKSPVNLYFLHHFGIETPIIQKRNFKLAGEISEQIELNGVKVGSEKSFDGDLTFNGKLKTQWKSNDSKYQANGTLSIDKTVGLKDERLIADLATMPKNIKFTTNAIALQTYVGRKIASEKTIGIGANGVATQVGSKYEIFTDYSSGVHHIYVQYENATTGYGKYKMNLLPNQSLGLETGYDIAIPYRKTGTLEASTKVSFDMNRNFFISAGVKLKINARKNKK